MEENKPFSRNGRPSNAQKIICISCKDSKYVALLVHPHQASLCKELNKDKDNKTSKATGALSLNALIKKNIKFSD